jgi:hypothetical protein
VVEAAFADADGRVPTLEGEVAHRRGDAIVTGAHGERWPISRDAFFEAYAPVPPTRAGEGGRYRKRPLRVFARQMPGPFSVRHAPCGDPLIGPSGDWLVQYGPGRYGVVSARIFDETYTMLDDGGDS